MHDSKYRISIIIPLYNAKKYIANCLDSILGSDLPQGSYEIIVVNDGSTDGCGHIVESYAAKHPIISLFNQENQGQSVARNLGIDYARGEYIWCIDCDDMVDGQLSPILYILDSLPGIDVVAVKLQKVSEKGVALGIECAQPNITHDIKMSGRDAVIQGYDPSSVCALIIRKELLQSKSLKFKPGITHQDVHLSYRLMAQAENVIFTNLMPYRYIIHPSSTSQSVNPEKKKKYVSDDVIIIKDFQQLANKMTDDRDLSATIYNRSQNILLGLLLDLRRNKSTWKPWGINDYVISRLKEEGLYPVSGKFDSFKKVVLGKILNFEKIIN